MIKRYLRRVRDNRLNQVTSAVELVDALCSLGGLQNCGAQLVVFDSEVSNTLDALATRLKGASDKMKEFFPRANEINFFPQQDSDDGSRFQIHVTAYSGVGNGARFEVDIDKATVQLVCPVKGFDNFEGDMSVDGQDDMTSESDDESTYEECGEEDDDEFALVEELYLEAAVDDVGAPESRKALRSTKGVPSYSSLNMVTGVKVEKDMRLGKIYTANQSSSGGRRGSSSGDDEEANNGMTARKNLLVKGILCLAREAFPTFRISDGRDENLDEYKHASGYKVPEKCRKGEGWARRARKGDMYGRKYIERFKPELFEFFKEGSLDSDKKQGPAIMLERLRSAHPDLYTLPNFAEIQSFVSQCVNREKGGNAEEPITNNRSQRWQGGNGVIEVLSQNEEMERAISRIVHHYGGYILPYYVLSRLRDQFSAASVDSQKNHLTKLIAKKRSDAIKERQRMLIG